MARKSAPSEQIAQGDSDMPQPPEDSIALRQNLKRPACEHEEKDDVVAMEVKEKENGENGDSNLASARKKPRSKARAKAKVETPNEEAAELDEKDANAAAPSTQKPKAKPRARKAKVKTPNEEAAELDEKNANAAAPSTQKPKAKARARKAKVDTSKEEATKLDEENADADAAASSTKKPKAKPRAKARVDTSKDETLDEQEKDDIAAAATKKQRAPKARPKAKARGKARAEKPEQSKDAGSPSNGSSSSSSTTSTSRSASSERNFWEKKETLGEASEEEDPEGDPTVELFETDDFTCDDDADWIGMSEAARPEISTLAEVFACSDRYIDRLYRYFGESRVKTLINNLSGCNIVTFYSGLGGAELSVMNLYFALCRWCRRYGHDEPVKPNVVLACDFDSSCQKVLLSHKVGMGRMG